MATAVRCQFLTASTPRADCFDAPDQLPSESSFSLEGQERIHSSRSTSHLTELARQSNQPYASHLKVSQSASTQPQSRQGCQFELTPVNLSEAPSERSVADRRTHETVLCATESGALAIYNSKAALRTSTSKACCGLWKEWLVHYIRNCFGAYVKVVYQYSWLFVSVSMLVCLALGSGFFLRDAVDGAERQYALQSSVAQQDSDLFETLFSDHLTRSEVIIVESKTGKNLLTNEFLDDLWNLHNEVLNLTVFLVEDGRNSSSSEEETKLSLLPSENASLSAVADPNASSAKSVAARRWLQADGDDMGDALSYGGRGGGRGFGYGFGGAGGFDQWEDDEADWLEEDEAADDSRDQVGPLGGSWGRLSSTMGGRGGEYGGDEWQLYEYPLDETNGTTEQHQGECDTSKAPPKNQITGLACKSALPPSTWGFANLCVTDSNKVCIPPRGIIFMYDDKKDYGGPLEYPEHTMPKLHDKFITDMWVSPATIQLNEFEDEVVGASAFLLKYSIVNDPDRKVPAELWEQALIDLITSHEGLKDASLYIKTERSLRDELSASTQIKNLNDYLLMGFTALLLFGYIAVMNFSADFYKLKSISAILGGVAAVLGYVGGVGLCHLCGLEHTNTASATPFLVLGVGVDDMFVMINSYTLTFTHAQAKDRLVVAMKDCGLSITITTLTNLIAFCIGASSPYLAIRNFCIFTAAGLLMGYVMALTFFLGCLCIDARREEARQTLFCGRAFCALPCYKRKSILPVQCHYPTPRAAELRRVSSSTFKLVSLQAAAFDARAVPPTSARGCCSVADLSVSGSSSLRGIPESDTHPPRCDAFDSTVLRNAADFATRSTDCDTAMISSVPDDRSPGSTRQVSSCSRGSSRAGERTGGGSDAILNDFTDPLVSTTPARPRNEPKAFALETHQAEGYGPGVDKVEPSAMQLRQPAAAHFMTCNLVSSTDSLRKSPVAGDCKNVTTDQNRLSQTKSFASSVDPGSVIEVEGLYDLRGFEELRADRGGDGDDGVQLDSGYRFLPYTERTLRIGNTMDMEPVMITDPSLRRYSSSMSDSQLLRDLPGEGFRARTRFFFPPPQTVDKYMNIDKQVSQLYAEGVGDLSRTPHKSTHALEDRSSSSMRSDSGFLTPPQWTPEELAEPPGNVGRKWRIAFLSYYGWFITRPIVKMLVLLVFTLYLAVAIRGCSMLRQGLDVRELASDDSYLSAFFVAQKRTFTKYGDGVSVFFRDATNWYLSDYMSSHAELHRLLSDAPYTMEIKNGMSEFLDSPLGADLPTDDPKFCNDMLSAWLKTPKGANFARDFVWKDNALQSWKLIIMPPYLSSSEEEGLFMDSVRGDVDSFEKLNSRAFSRMFIFYESDRDILANTLTNMAFAAAAMMLVSVLLLSSVWTGVLVILTLVMIDAGVIGFMYYWDLPLNMLTMVNLIISIGFSVDYSAHICHTFCHCVGKTRNLRVIETLVLMGNPVFHGAFSTQLGVLMLAFSTSYILRVFFKMMTLVLVLGVLHGIVFLPVLLSLVGPMTGAASDETVAMSLRGFLVGLRMFFRDLLTDRKGCGCFRSSGRHDRRRRGGGRSGADGGGGVSEKGSDKRPLDTSGRGEGGALQPTKDTLEPSVDSQCFSTESNNERTKRSSGDHQEEREGSVREQGPATPVFPSPQQTTLRLLYQTVSEEKTEAASSQATLLRRSISTPSFLSTDHVCIEHRTVHTDRDEAVELCDHHHAAAAALFPEVTDTPTLAIPLENEEGVSDWIAQKSFRTLPSRIEERHNSSTDNNDDDDDRRSSRIFSDAAAAAADGLPTAVSEERASPFLLPSALLPTGTTSHALPSHHQRGIVCQS